MQKSRQPYCLFLSLLLTTIINAQVGIGTTTPNPSSVLDITSIDKGILVPRVALSNVTDNSIDGINTAAEGLLIYNTNAATTGGDGTGYYFYNGSIWSKFSTATVTSDADFFEEGTTTPPDAITDDMYTQGNVAIGKTTADYPLDVRSNGSRTVYINNNGNNNTTRYGLYTDMTNQNRGTRVGVYNNLASTHQVWYSPTKIGVQNNIRNSTRGNAHGMLNNLNNGGTTVQRGLFSNIAGSSDGLQYGTYTNLTNSGSGQHYGHWARMTGAGNGNKHGYWTQIAIGAGGTHYGVYSDVQKTGSFAGYFIGDIRMTNLGGSGNQMVVVDNDGDLSTQNLPSGDIDWYEEGTTNNPDAITDDIYTQGNVAIGKNTADFPLDIRTGGSRSIHTNNTSGVSSPGYGLVNTFSTSTSGDRAGVLNNLNYTTGFGLPIKMGILNTLSNSTRGRVYGVSNILNNQGNAVQRGISSELLGTSNSPQYGTHTTINNSGNGLHFGHWSRIIGTGTGDKYGYWTEISTTAGGTHYGVYSDVQKAGSFAGYFIGDVRMTSLGGSGDQMVVVDNDGDLNVQAIPGDDADADPTNEIELPTGGNNGDVLTTDGSGNYNWVTDANDSDADFYEIGTTSAPNAITDNVYTQGQLVIGGTASNQGAQLQIDEEGDNSAIHINTNSDDVSAVTMRRTDNNNRQGIAFQNSGGAHGAVIYNTSNTDTLINGLAIATIGNEASAADLGTTATFKDDGTIRLHDYGIGNNTDTAPVYLVGLQADGDLVEYNNSIEAVSSPTFAANWENYSVNFGNEYEDARYYIRDNRVHLAGLIRKSIAINNAEVMVSLPAGYRPLKRYIFNIQSNYGAIRVDVLPNGEVIFLGGNQSGGQQWVSLSGISFRID